MASSLFNPRALQSFSTISLQVFFGLPLGLVPSTSYSIHFFTQSLSSFRTWVKIHSHLIWCCAAARIRTLQSHTAPHSITHQHTPDALLDALQCHVGLYSTTSSVNEPLVCSFSVLFSLPLVGRQEEHPARKKIE